MGRPPLGTTPVPVRCLGMTSPLTVNADSMRKLAAQMHRNANSAPETLSALCEKMHAAARALTIEADGLDLRERFTV